jgi:hypothetical protein
LVVLVWFIDRLEKEKKLNEKKRTNMKKKDEIKETKKEKTVRIKDRNNITYA